MALILMVYVITIYSVVLGRSPVVVGEIELSFVIRLAARGWGICSIQCGDEVERLHS